MQKNHNNGLVLTTQITCANWLVACFSKWKYLKIFKYIHVKNMPGSHNQRHVFLCENIWKFSSISLRKTRHEPVCTSNSRSEYDPNNGPAQQRDLNVTRERVNGWAFIWKICIIFGLIVYNIQYTIIYILCNIQYTIYIAVYSHIQTINLGLVLYAQWTLVVSWINCKLANILLIYWQYIDYILFKDYTYRYDVVYNNIKSI